MRKYQLGKWDLTELVKDPKNPDFEKQIKLVQTQTRDFENNKKKLSPKVTSKDFLKMLHSLENIVEKINKME